MTIPGGQAHLRRRVIKACTACKQSKVRCDADGKVGRTCSRCRARGLECEVDAHFKRTPVRERMKAMAAELKELRQTVREGGTSPDRRRLDSFSGIEIEPLTDGFTYPSPDSFQYAGSSMAQRPFGLGDDFEDDMTIEPASLGPISFSVDDICECFKAYSEHFHPHLPILNLATPVDALQRSSPFLFKTVLVIVTHRFHSLQQGGHDLELLAEVYQGLLNQTILSSPLTIHTIQAILLVCTWPLPTPSQLAEPSWLYCGVAMQAASYLNLGRVASKPSYQGGQLSSMDVENMARTWVALFLLSTNIGVFLGAPLPFKHSSDIAGIESRISRKDVPRCLGAHAAIAVVVAKHTALLSPDTDMVTHDALVQIHIDEMDRVARVYQDVWNDKLEFSLQGSKLHLYISIWIRGCCAVNGVCPGDDTHQPVPSVDILASAAICACRVIAIYDRLIGTTSSPKSESNLPSFTKANVLPKNYFRRVSHATFFLLRFVCFSKLCRESDRDNARQHIYMSISAIKRSSSTHQPQDEMLRATLVLEKLLEHGTMLQEQRLQIDDRGSASIYWDTLHRSLQIRGKSTTNTDLMELIDPTRTTKELPEEKNGILNNQLPTPGMSNVSVPNSADVHSGEEGVMWDDSLMEFFDLNMFDIADLGTAVVT